MDVVNLSELSDESFEIRFGGVPGRIAVEAMSEVLFGFGAGLEEINRLALSFKPTSRLSPPAAFAFGLA